MQAIDPEFRRWEQSKRHRWLGWSSLGGQATKFTGQGIALLAVDTVHDAKAFTERLLGLAKGHEVQANSAVVEGILTRVSIWSINHQKKGEAYRGRAPRHLITLGL